MQLVFFSSDRLEVQRVGLTLAAAGIACEVRESFALRNDFANPSEAEVWTKKNEDLHRAFMLCVAHSIGFAKCETNISEDLDDIAVAA